MKHISGALAEILDDLAKRAVPAGVRPMIHLAFCNSKTDQLEPRCGDPDPHMTLYTALVGEATCIPCLRESLAVREIGAQRPELTAEERDRRNRIASQRSAVVRDRISRLTFGRG